MLIGPLTSDQRTARGASEETKHTMQLTTPAYDEASWRSKRRSTRDRAESTGKEKNRRQRAYTTGRLLILMAERAT